MWPNCALLWAPFFFLSRVNEYSKTNIPHISLSTQTRTWFIQSVNVASCPAQLQPWASFDTSTMSNLPLVDTQFGKCPLSSFGSYQPTLADSNFYIHKLANKQTLFGRIYPIKFHNGNSWPLDTLFVRKVSCRELAYKGNGTSWLDTRETV